MKHIAKYMWIGLLLATNSIPSCCPTSSSCQTVKTVFIPISQGQNLYTQYHKPMYLEEDSDCCWASDLSATYRFMQTRNACSIATSLFQYNPLVFVGSETGSDTNRATNALIPEYFGMGEDTNASFNLSPRIRNNIIDLQLALGGEKVWFQINLPITRTNWQINSSCCPIPAIGTETIDGSGSVLITGPAIPTPATDTPYTFTSNNTNNTGIDSDGDSGVSADSTYLNQYLESGLSVVNAFAFDGSSEDGLETAGLGYYVMPEFVGTTLTNEEQTVLTASTSLEIKSAGTNPAKTLSSALNGGTFGAVSKRSYNLFNIGAGCCNTAAWGLADIILQLGYDFCKTDCKHLGLYIRVVIPTGTNLNQCWAQYVFSPIIGNGRHFELGIGFSGHMDLWECDESNFVAFLDGYITHPFSSSTYRSYNLPNMPMSRYAILKAINSDYTATGSLAVLGDVNSGCINTSEAVRGEAVLDFAYNTCNWQVGGGYAFSGLSGETSNCCNSANGGLSTSGTKLYGFKGDCPMADFNMNWKNTLANSALFIPSEAGTGDNEVTFTANINSDVAQGGNAYLYGTPTPANATNTFALPDFTGCSGLMGAQILNRIFGHIDYTWKDCCWQPEFGILGSIGFGSGSKVTAQYWDLGARLGFAF